MLNTLIAQLQNPDPQTRIETLCALVMVLETEALDILRKMWETEQVPQVKEAVQWAGRQILAAKQQGYSTVAAMRFAYRLDLPDKAVTKNDEQKRKLEDAMREARFHHNVSGPDATGAAATFLLTGAASLALTHGALGVFYKPGVKPSYNAELQGLKYVAAILEQERTERERPIVPPKPADTSIKVWLKKLDAPDTQTRLSAARQLLDFNNPAALGPLGWVSAHDNDPEVRQRAQKTGLDIYNAALYWQIQSQ